MERLIGEWISKAVKKGGTASREGGQGICSVILSESGVGCSSILKSLLLELLAIE